MKTMVINFGLFLMLFITCLSITSIGKKQVIKEEINEALSISIRNTMELWVDNTNLSKEELIDNFLNVFKTNVNSESTYNVYFYEIDTTNGLMDIGVKASFTYPNKRTGTVNIRKTMIYDEKMN